MILKQTDNKTSQLKILEKLLEESTSDSQKELIKKDYHKLKNGYEAEKEKGKEPIKGKRISKKDKLRQQKL